MIVTDGLPTDGAAEISRRTGVRRPSKDGVDPSRVFCCYRGVDQRADDLRGHLAHVRRRHLLDELQRDINVALLAAQRGE